MMKKSKQMRIWFALALPSAWLISWLIWFIRLYDDDPGQIVRAGIIAWVGFCYFPLGLLAFFGWNIDTHEVYLVPIIVFVYAAYAILIIGGMTRPHIMLFLVLCLLLLANIIGCQLDPLGVV
jgi:hypothetical protein